LSFGALAATAAWAFMGAAPASAWDPAWLLRTIDVAFPSQGSNGQAWVTRNIYLAAGKYDWTSSWAAEFGRGDSGREIYLNSSDYTWESA